MHGADVQDQESGELLQSHATYSERADQPSCRFVDVRADPRFLTLDTFQQANAHRAEQILNLCINLNYITPTAGRILDFGAGSGGPTLALAHYAELGGATVDAVDVSPVVHEIVDAHILAPERVHQEDGFDLLRRNSEAFDLVTAFMFGPDVHGNMFCDLLTVASGALTEGGKLLVSSDSGTMDTVRNICQDAAIPYEDFTGTSDVPGTIIISEIDTEALAMCHPRTSGCEKSPILGGYLKSEFGLLRDPPPKWVQLLLEACLDEQAGEASQQPNQTL